MNCEKCKKKEATIHLTEIIKDVKSEVHLCEICARDIGLNSKLSNFSLSVPELLSFLDIDEIDDHGDSEYCKNCGESYMEYRKTGKLGCPECYSTLEESLQPVIAGFHGSSRHIGKNPKYYNQERIVEKHFIIENEDSLGDLKTELEIAVYEERYEDAAVLRDRIKEYENN